MIGKGANGEAAAAPRQMPQERTWNVTIINPITGAEKVEAITAHVIDVGVVLVFDKLIQNDEGQIFRVPGIRAVNHWLDFTDVTEALVAPEKPRILTPGGRA